MLNKSARKLFFFVFLLAVISWPVYQLYDLFHVNEKKGNAIYLLYQVSLFQLELLNSFLHEAEGVPGTEELNSLKQAVYSTGYTHDRLVLAVGTKEMPKLTSLNELMQYILRLQIGGQRPLKPDEIKTLQQISASYAKIYTVYGQMMTSNGNIISSQRTQLTVLDKQVFLLLQQKLMK